MLFMIFFACRFTTRMNIRTRKCCGVGEYLDHNMIIMTSLLFELGNIVKNYSIMMTLIGNIIIIFFAVSGSRELIQKKSFPNPSQNCFLFTPFQKSKVGKQKKKKVEKKSRRRSRRSHEVLSSSINGTTFCYVSHPLFIPLKDKK